MFAMTDREGLRDKIRDVGVQIAEVDALLDERGRLVAEAREAGMTYREIAGLLEMTETGLRKSQRAYEARHSATTKLAS